MTRPRTPARRLAIYRLWLLPLVACSVALITVVPVAILDRGMHDPTAVLSGVAVLFGWLAAFIGTWMNYERLPSA
ncbi:hypothetical protein ACFWIW_10565 [Amycolatopsis sp. NPDC058340]|uniref:hypothetical protein n=1 Tax=Amycolatopsis sp. NPDC058340 TaxID=3346453 RepID=UPI0036676BDC